MKTTLKTLIALTAISLTAQSQTNWNLDASHSKLGFSVTHMMVSETEGKFKIYEGKVSSKSDIDFTDASIDFKIDVNSINTDDEKRDGHLKSPDFFDVASFPNITFKSTSMKVNPKIKNSYILTGDLTMHGVTKKVTLTAIGASKIVKDPYGMMRYAFKVIGELNRVDFGLKYNSVLEAGGVALSEVVKIDCTIEITKAK